MAPFLVNKSFKNWKKTVRLLSHSESDNRPQIIVMVQKYLKVFDVLVTVHRDKTSM